MGTRACRLAKAPCRDSIDWPAFGVDALGPIQRLHERRGAQKFAGGAIQHIEVTVAIRMQQKLARAAFVQSAVEQHRPGLRVPIVRVVRRELEIPFQLARIGVQRQQRIE
jgi:hypothetical protein